ncbi:hypothetical protein B0H17DRAFT_1142408 [Mycena rosella]|uniref:Uncharacterized protein n=1 Tax=Mycena rosella TaxID=1033263 RepID=A0AAD7CXX9_MYCRO|nr:hypothetical protein B0H17DRAFT_1142408 [Mycena rosella]
MSSRAEWGCIGGSLNASYVSKVRSMGRLRRTEDMLGQEATRKNGGRVDERAVLKWGNFHRMAAFQGRGSIHETAGPGRSKQRCNRQDSERAQARRDDRGKGPGFEAEKGPNRGCAGVERSAREPAPTPPCDDSSGRSTGKNGADRQSGLSPACRTPNPD